MSISGKTWWLVIGFLVTGFLMWYFQSIVVYLSIAAVLSIIGRPIAAWMQKWRIRKWDVPNWVGALLTLGVLYGFFALIFVLFIPPLLAEVAKLQSLNVETIESGLREPIAAIEAWATRYHITPDDMSVEQYLQEKMVSLVSTVDISSILNGVVGFTGDFFAAVFSVSFILFFFLKEPTLLPEMLFSITPSASRPKLKRVLRESQTLLTRYLIGILIETILVGTMVTLGLWALGVKNAPLIGFFAGIFNVVPYLGPIVGTVIGLLFIILGNLQMDFYAFTMPLIGKSLAVFVVAQLIDNMIIQPLIYGQSVKAHPLEIFLVFLAAGSLGGVVGMIIAVPCYTILRVLAREFLYHFEIVRNITKDISTPTT